MKRNSKKKTKAVPAQLATGELIDINTFAATLQWHPESVRRACRQERVEGIKLGRGWRIPKAVAEAIMRNGIPPRS